MMIIKIFICVCLIGMSLGRNEVLQLRKMGAVIDLDENMFQELVVDSDMKDYRMILFFTSQTDFFACPSCR